MKINGRETRTIWLAADGSGDVEIIDQTKLRVPIWKKEHYADGASGWINSTAPSGPNPATDS